jgi:site-specific DNA recombinase
MGQQAAIYVRVSTDKQEADGTSLGTQEAACRAYAAERGYTVAEVYREVHTGSELWERPQLTAMRERVRASDFGVVITYAVDRLSRNQAHLFILVDEWERHGATPAFVTEELDQSPLGKIILSLKGFAAEVEREKIQERVRRGLAARAASGKLKPGPKPLYGYRWPVEADGAGSLAVVRERYEIDPATGPVVRRIFADYVQGMPLLALAKQLTAEGVPTPTGSATWVRCVIQKLIRNPSYKGEAYVNRTMVVRERGKAKSVARPRSEWVPLADGIVPALVDAATWDAAQVRAERNSAESLRHNLNPETFLLRSGYILCGHCGRSALATNRKERHGKLTPAYIVFPTPESHRDCPRASITAAALDAATIAYLRRVALNADVIEWELDRLAEAGEATDADLAAVDARLSEVRRKQRVLSGSIEALDDAEAAEPLLARLKSLAAEKKALDRERVSRAARAGDHAATIARLREMKEHAGEIADNFDRLPYRSKRDILAAINLTVRLYPSVAPDRYTFESDADGLLRAIGYPSSISAIPNCASPRLRWAAHEVRALAAD